MYHRLFIFMSFLMIASHAQAMRTKPMISNNTTVVTSDSKEYKIKIQKLEECQTIASSFDLAEQPTVFSLPRITSEEWLLFHASLEQAPETAASQLKDKKRLRSVLDTAHYLGHSALFDACTNAWQENDFDIGDEFEVMGKEVVKVRELPFEVELAIAHKTLQATPFNASLSAWIARGTQIPSQKIRLACSIWTCCTNTSNTLSAVGTVDGRITVIDARSHAHYSWPAHTREVSDLHFNSQNGFLYSVARDGSIKAWDPQNNFVLSREIQTGIVDLPFSFNINPQGTLLATPLNDGINVWDLASGATRVILTPQRSTCAAFNSSGMLLAAGTQECTVQIIDALTGACIQTLNTPEHIINQVKFNQNNTLLAAGSRSGFIYIWNLTNYRLVAILPAHTGKIWGIEFSPCNRFLFSCSADQTVKIFDLATNGCIRSLNQKADVQDMRLSSDLQLVIGSRDSTVCFLSIKKLLERYQQRKRFFERDVSAAQAQLIKRAFAAKNNEDDEDYEGELIDVSSGQDAKTFSQFPDEIQAMLLKELPFKKESKKKKRKTDDDDKDFLPE